MKNYIKNKTTKIKKCKHTEIKNAKCKKVKIKKYKNNKNPWVPTISTKTQKRAKHKKSKKNIKNSRNGTCASYFSQNFQMIYRDSTKNMGCLLLRFANYYKSSVAPSMRQKYQPASRAESC